MLLAYGSVGYYTPHEKMMAAVVTLIVVAVVLVVVFLIGCFAGRRHR